MLHKPRCDRMVGRYTARDASLEAELEDSSLLLDRLNSSFGSSVPLTVSYCRPLGYCFVLPKSDNLPHQCHYRRFLVALDDDALVSQLADVLDDLLSHPLDVPPFGRHHVREQRLASPGRASQRLGTCLLLLVRQGRRSPGSPWAR